MDKLPAFKELYRDILSGLKKKNVLYALGAALALSLVYFLLLSPPPDFPEGTRVRVERGASLRSVSSYLEREKIIKSKVAFEFFVILFGKEKGIVSADYSFERKLPVFEIARRIGLGAHRTAPISVTIPEGFDTIEIGDTFERELQNFNKEEFLILAKGREGYLFPDTYFFLTNANENQVLRSMEDNFKKKIAAFDAEIRSSGKSERDIITMASIIEREAKGDDDRGVISGILWKRISIGMPLQADAAPVTYEEKGLPKTPIANPGLESIKAAIHPENSPYLYYLHDKEGRIHYARNLKEHNSNISKYLK